MNDTRPSSHVGYHIWQGDGYCVDSPHEIKLCWPMKREELEVVPRWLLREIVSSEMDGVTMVGLPFIVNTEEMLGNKVRSLNTIMGILGMDEQFVFRE